MVNSAAFPSGKNVWLKVFKRSINWSEAFWSECVSKCSISPTKSTLQSISQSLGATSNTFSKPSYSKRRQQKQNKRNAILKAFDEKPKKNESKIKLKLKDLDDKSPKTKKK